MVKSPLKRAKQRAWKWFSEYIRLKSADSEGYVRCVTCGVKKKWKGDGMQSGHYIDGRSGAVLFEEWLVHPQCFHCNHKGLGGLAGNKISYSAFMSKEYKLTIEELDEIRQKKHAEVKKYTITDYLDIEQRYKAKVKEMDTEEHRRKLREWENVFDFQGGDT